MSFHAGRIRAGIRSRHDVSGRQVAPKKHDDAARKRITNGPIKFNIASPNELHFFRRYMQGYTYMPGH